MTKLLKYAGVKAALAGIRPSIVGMILATACTMFLSVFFKLKTIETDFVLDVKSLVIFVIIAGIALGYSKWKKKAFLLIVLIVISGVLGVMLFGI